MDHQPDLCTFFAEMQQRFVWRWAGDSYRERYRRMMDRMLYYFARKAFSA